jgi:hypothetical protein
MAGECVANGGDVSWIRSTASGRSSSITAAGRTAARSDTGEFAAEASVVRPSTRNASSGQGFATLDGLGE